MAQIYNVYSDESCHLENDSQNVMVLGALWNKVEKTKEVSKRLREIKKFHGLSENFEIKWTKVSDSKFDFYQAIIDYFFDDDDLHFRGLIAHKSSLSHASFNQSHDDWYYKMMFTLFEPIIQPQDRYRIYLDKKDTRSARKVVKLHDVLCKNVYDFDRKVVERVQVLESHHVEQLQLADLIIGAISYLNRGLSGNVGKEKLIERVKERSGYKLTNPTLLREPKLNLFVWHGK